MDKRKSILNVSVSLFFRIVTMVLAIAVKRSLILVCGNEANGLNALYLSIIGILAVAELGVGSAISFCMYRPIVEGDSEKVSALYHLFRRWYLAVGALMMAGGLAMTPFLHYFARDYALLDVDLYLSFVLMLLSVVLTYLFGAKTALINAYKNNYITTAINSGGMLLQYVLQILVLHITGSFYGFLLCRSGAVVLQWAATEVVARKKHGAILNQTASIDGDTRQELSQKVKAMFLHKIGALLVNTVDSVVISAFVGVVALGQFSNYTAIQQSMDSLISLAIGSLVSVVGHMYAEKGRQATRICYERFQYINFAVATIFYLGYYAVIDELVAILFTEKLVAAQTISLVITLNGFLRCMRLSTTLFRDATGTFYHDRWKPLVEGVVNIVLSVLLVRRIGVEGVIVATILTNLLICHVVEPYVIYRHAFVSSPRGHYLRSYGRILLFACALGAFRLCARTGYGPWGDFLVNGFLSVAISLSVCALAALLDRDIRTYLYSLTAWRKNRHDHEKH